MSKSIKLKNDNYIDSTSIVHKKRLLSDILNSETEWRTLANYNTSYENWRGYIQYKRIKQQVQIIGDAFPSPYLSVNAFDGTKLCELENDSNPNYTIDFPVFAKNKNNKAITDLNIRIQDGKVYLWNSTGTPATDISYFCFNTMYIIDKVEF